MKLHVLANDGSPLGVSVPDIYGQGRRGIGVGGAELALLTLCEEWTNAGHEVVLYNNPIDASNSPFEQRLIDDFDPKQDRDVVIVFRSPNKRLTDDTVGLKVWFSCDQFTVGSFKEFAPKVDKIVCISKFHADHFKTAYGIENTHVIDLPLRAKDFPSKVEKVPYRMIFTSVPDRGLMYLWYMWPEIQRDIPEASLVITSDYRLWGLSTPNNQKHKMSWLRHENVRFVGALQRLEYIEELCKAELFVYPSMYDSHELFCISCSEAQFAGAYPVTSSWGALQTTNMGIIIDGKPSEEPFKKEFMKTVYDLLGNRSELVKAQKEISMKAFDRFSPERILEQWEKEIFNG